MSAPNTTTVVTKDQTWKFITAILLIPLALVFFLNSIFTAKREAETSEQARAKAELEYTTPFTEIITVTASQPSKEINVSTRNGLPRRIVISIIQDDVSYIVHWNGGESNKLNGGFDEHILARNKRPAGWTSNRPAEGGKARSVSFQLEQGFGASKIEYTLYPL